MDTMDEIIERGDQYLKHKWLRKREYNQSPECYSKSLKRQQAALAAINKNITTSPLNLHPKDDPHDRMFANTSEIREVVDRRGNDSSSHLHSSSYLGDDEPLSSRTYSVFDDSLEPAPNNDRPIASPCSREFDSATGAKSQQHCPTDDNSNNIEYKRSSQFRYGGDGVREPVNERKSYGGPFYGRGQRERWDFQPRLSLGGNFARSTNNELDMQHNLSKDFEDEFERGNAELQRQGPDLFFGTRVLEILEPQVVKVERKISTESTSVSRRHAFDMTFIRENLEEIQLRQSAGSDESTVVASLDSEDMRDIDEEIDKLPFQSDNGEQQEQQQEELQSIDETPVPMPDNLLPKKLFYNDTALAEKNDETTDFNWDMTKSFDGSQNLTVPEKDATYTMPISDSHVNKLDKSSRQPQNHHDSTAGSFLKRNTTFLFRNLKLPKIMRRKPNFESTRKIRSNGGETLSPISQIGSTISNITMPNTHPSLDAYGAMTKVQQQQQLHRQLRLRQRDMDGTLPFEVENFLELPLGDEHYNSTITYAYSDMRDRTNSYINASELMSEEGSLTKNKTEKFTRMPATESSSKPRRTLNRTLTIYKSLTNSIKKKFRGVGKKSPRPLQQHQDAGPPDVAPKDPKKANVKKLLEAMEVQQTLIYQASKALTLCNSTREFSASLERVESERLLLLAQLRRRAAQDEIGRLTRDSGLYCERGELTIESLSLQLRRERLSTDDLVEWFVIVASEGSTVWATQACECPSSGPRLHFPGQLKIPGLPPDFKLTLTIYSLKMQRVVVGHEEKYHIGKSGRGSGRSVMTLFGRSDKTRRSGTMAKRMDVGFSGVQESSFLPSGSLEIMLHDLSLKSPWPLSGVPSKSVLHGTIDLSLACHLELLISHAGFLTHGDEVGGLVAWNRRWCVLEGRHLLFWNYPREEDCKPPLYKIDLVDCASPRRIGLVERTLCAKPRTLLVELARSRGEGDRDSVLVKCRSTCTLVRNLLSCDTIQDLTEWQSKLNHVVSALREWNIIDTKMDS